MKKTFLFLTLLPSSLMGCCIPITSCSKEGTKPISDCKITFSIQGCGSLDKTSIIVPNGTTWGIAKQQLQPKPNQGYYFDSWGMNGSVISDSYIIKSNINLIAHFLEITTYELIKDIDESIQITKIDTPTKGKDFKLTYTIDTSNTIDLSNCLIKVGDVDITQYATINRYYLLIPGSYINSNLYVKLISRTKYTYTISTAGSIGTTFVDLPSFYGEEGYNGINATYTYDSDTRIFKEDECDILVGNKSIKNNKNVEYLNGKIFIPYNLINDNVTIKIVARSILLTNSWSEIVDYCEQYENGLISSQLEFVKKFSNEDGPITSSDELIGCISYLSINNVKHIVRIIDIDHDVIANSNTKAALTFELVTLLSDSDNKGLRSTWYDDNSTEFHDNYDYLNSTLRKNLTGQGNGTIQWYAQDGRKFVSKKLTALDMIQNDLVPYIKTVTKQISTSINKGSSYEVVNYNDKLFPLTYSEAYTTTKKYVNVEGTIYKYWSNNISFSSHIKQALSKFNCYYWATSPYLSNLGFAYRVSNNGTIDTTYIASAEYVSFAFCI